ncbi:hypothetical protein H5410_029712 [Solanum commersonii]|uniref:Uncharacterized protein n=1 Tax=Solanum commersonii TaxID=4109 RepID=A0A9J5YH64_SOLCO|nr:hypothetical protein H5410_029712 [Solanum commersonii]
MYTSESFAFLGIIDFYMVSISLWEYRNFKSRNLWHFGSKAFLGCLLWIIGVEFVLACPSRRCNPSATDSTPSALVSPDEKNVALAVS